MAELRKIELDWVDDPDRDGVFGAPQTRIYQVMPNGSREQIELRINYVDR